MLQQIDFWCRQCQITNACARETLILALVSVNILTHCGEVHGSASTNKDSNSIVSIKAVLVYSSQTDANGIPMYILFDNFIRDDYDYYKLYYVHI